MNRTQWLDSQVGKQFGWLTVTGAERNSAGRTVALVRCVCGKCKSVYPENIRKGATRSCGCLVGITNRTHGMSQSSEFAVWSQMLERCERSTHPSYRRYGARGISVCARWHKFEAFLADMGRRPSPKHSLDRIDNDGNYEAANCRWALARIQANNTSRNRYIEHMGERLTMAQWSRRIGVRARTIRARIDSGVPTAKVLSRRLYRGVRPTAGEKA